MKKPIKAVTASIVGLTLIGTSVVAISSQYEDDDDHQEDSHYLQMIDQASLRVEQAISIALGEIPGKIIEAEIEWEDGVLVWEVEVLSSENQVYEIEIDATDGRIIEMEREDS